MVTYFETLPTLRGAANLLRKCCDCAATVLQLPRLVTLNGNLIELNELISATQQEWIMIRDLDGQIMPKAFVCRELR